MTACGIIIAKDNSNRFPGKNYTIVSGYPLFFHGINLLANHIDIDDIYVATDSGYIITHCLMTGINIIERGINVSRDEEPYFNVLKYAWQSIDQKYDIIVSVLANSFHHDVDCIEKGLDIFKNDNKVSEIRSFDDYGNQSGVFMFRKEVFEADCMVLNHMAGIKSNGKEIHYQDEIE